MPRAPGGRCPGSVDLTWRCLRPSLRRRSDSASPRAVSGRCTDKQRQVLATVTAVSHAMIAAIRPGVTLTDIQATGESEIPSGRRKYMQTRRYSGHHTGLYVGDLTLGDAWLEPGMMFTVGPCYYNDDRQIVCSSKMMFSSRPRASIT